MDSARNIDDFALIYKTRYPHMAEHVLGNVCHNIDKTYMTIWNIGEEWTVINHGSVNSIIKEGSDMIVRNFMAIILLPELPETVRWKDDIASIIFDKISITNNQLPCGEWSISLKKNNKKAIMNGRWPTFCNMTREIRIPLMCSTTFNTHESPLIVTIHDIKSVSELVENPTGASIDNWIKVKLSHERILFLKKYQNVLNTPPNLRPPISQPLSSGQYSFTKTWSSETLTLKYNSQMSSFIADPLYSKHTISLIVTYTPPAPMKLSDNPVKQISLFGMYVFDGMDLLETNWLRCGLVPPIINKTPSDETASFIYYIPFSSDTHLPAPPSCFEPGGVVLVLNIEGDKQSIESGSFSVAIEKLIIICYTGGIARII